MKRSTAVIAGISASLLTIVLGVGYAIWCRRAGISFCSTQSSQNPTTLSIDLSSEDSTNDDPDSLSPSDSESPAIDSSSLAESTPQLESYRRSGQYAIELAYSDAVWQLNEGDDYPASELTGTRDLIQLVAKGKDDFNYKTNIMFKIEQVDRANQSLSEYAETQEFRIRTLNTFEIINPRRAITLNNGNAAYEIVYSGDDGEHRLKRKRIIVQPQRESDLPYFHLVTYTASVEYYDEHLEEFEDIFQSVILR